MVSATEAVLIASAMGAGAVIIDRAIASGFEFYRSRREGQAEARRWRRDERLRIYRDLLALTQEFEALHKRWEDTSVDTWTDLAERQEGLLHEITLLGHAEVAIHARAFAHLVIGYAEVKSETPEAEVPDLELAVRGRLLEAMRRDLGVPTGSAELQEAGFDPTK